MVEDYDSYTGEIGREDFPMDSWQADDVYVGDLLREGRALIQRARDGIFDEYGWDRTSAMNADGQKHDMGRIRIVPDNVMPVPHEDSDRSTVAWMCKSSMDALIKKLLRAMITNDHFFVTLGGHGDGASGRGNNFGQSYMMQFHHVMEPIFDRLGMVLVSSNLAQEEGGVGATVASALAGRGIYGENDVVFMDAASKSGELTEKEKGAQDLFVRQALLSGLGDMTKEIIYDKTRKRVPIILDISGGKTTVERLHRDVHAHVGGVMANSGVLLPTHYNGEESKYNAKCWVERNDVQPDTTQRDNFEGQSWNHPGYIVHQSTARKLTLLFLHALDEALLLWQEEVLAKGNPLHGKHWHLLKEEEKILSALLATHASTTECGMLFHFLPRVCTTPMKGATEWTPRWNPYHSSLQSLMVKAGDTPEDLVELKESLLYKARDVRIPSQIVPEGEVDVGMIARSLPQQKSRGIGGSREKERLLLATTRHQRINHQRLLASNTSHLQSTASIKDRHLDADDNIVPGEGWAVNGHPSGFCDGTSNSVCKRNDASNCLLSGYNEGRGVLEVNGLSGWLVFDLKSVTQGIVLARIENWRAGDDEDPGRVRRRRTLKQSLPPTWKLEVSVNSKIQGSWSATELENICYSIGNDNMICVLWNDEERAALNMAGDVELAMRLVGTGGVSDTLGITHLYYA
mmetsp:Transcript_41004/g.86167  ORF Transcript_41004/g.86167 Transcript_41004/m.86167 type:complete len:687 (-) Transcript_41004:173-2233(-)